jgi:hypothetical protein
VKICKNRRSAKTLALQFNDLRWQFFRFFNYFTASLREAARVQRAPSERDELSTATKNVS